MAEPGPLYFGQGMFPYSLAAEQAAIKAFEAMERYWLDRAEREASYDLAGDAE
jgi:hypothetical protein